MKRRLITFSLMLFFIVGFIGVALSYPGRIGDSWDGDGHGGSCHVLNPVVGESVNGKCLVEADKAIYPAATRVKLTITITGFTEVHWKNATTDRGGQASVGIPYGTDNNSLFGLGVNFMEAVIFDVQGNADPIHWDVIAPETDGEWKLTVLVQNGWNHTEDDDLDFYWIAGSVTITVGADILGGIASLLFGEVGFLGILASPIGLAGIGAVIVILAVVAKKRG
jgi:hypothetical protein